MVCTRRMFKAILEEVNSSPDLSKENLIDRIKDKLQQANQLIYGDWEKSKFDINHLFIQDFVLSKLAKDDEKLLKFFLKQGETLLCVAARHGCIKVVKNLLENAAKIDVKVKYGTAPLHGAAAYGHTQVVELLLKEGAKVNLQGKDRKTPLHYAAEHGHIKTAKLLLKNGANIDLKDKNGYTPLGHALHSKYPKTAKLLLDYGADPSFIHRPKVTKAGATGVVISAVVVPLVLAYPTALPPLAIVGITVASALTVGGIAYGVAYKVSEHSLSSKLSEVSCSNIREQETVQP